MDNAIMFMDDELLELDGISNERKDWLTYTYNGTPVPRVSHILSQCRDNEWLVNWAAVVGKSKVDYYREKACTIGSIAHEIIENYLITKYKPSLGTNAPVIEYADIDSEYRASVYNSVENFKLWEKRLNESFGCQIEDIFGFEVPIVTPWYGGTIDGIIKINGLWYIIDFKTSKEIDPSYILQTAAYLWGVSNGFLENAPDISGIGIIRVDKKAYGKIDDLFLNKFDPYQLSMLDNAMRCFGSYVNAYYRSKSIDYTVNKYHKEYEPIKVFLSTIP